MTKIVIPDAAFGGPQAPTEWDKLMDPARKALEALIAKGDEMADRIEELEANLSEQIEWVKSLADDLIAAEGREARLKEKLAKAVEVAEKSIKWLRLYGADVHREAATLAELTGGKDD